MSGKDREKWALEAENDVNPQIRYQTIRARAILATTDFSKLDIFS